MSQPESKTDLISFTYQNLPLRIEIDDDGEPLFHVGDLCAILGHSNPSQAIRQHLEADDLTKREVIDSLGRTQLANFAREPGMWSLLLGSHAEFAKPTKRWIVADVLPTLRKTGTYQLTENVPLQKRQQKVLENAQARERIARDYERQARKEAAQAKKNLEHFASVWLAQFPADDRLLRHWEMGHTVRDCVRLNLPHAPYRATLERVRLLKSVGLLDPVKNQSARQLADMRCAHVSPLTGKPVVLSVKH